MRLSTIMRNAGVTALLIAVVGLGALAAKAEPHPSEQQAEQDTFLRDEFDVDADGPGQDKVYDEDDQEYDEMDDYDSPNEDDE